MQPDIPTLCFNRFSLSLSFRSRRCRPPPPLCYTHTHTLIHLTLSTPPPPAKQTDGTSVAIPRRLCCLGHSVCLHTHMRTHTLFISQALITLSGHK